MAASTSTSSELQTPQSNLEPGDRFELAVIPGSNRVRIPETIPAMGVRLAAVEDANGQPLAATFDPYASQLVVPPLSELPAVRGQTAWLEYQGEGRFRLIVEESALGPADAERLTEQGVRITLDPNDLTIV